MPSIARCAYMLSVAVGSHASLSIEYRVADVTAQDTNIE